MSRPDPEMRKLLDRVQRAERQVMDLWSQLRRPADVQASGDGFWAKITSASRDTPNWRWSYGFVEVAKTSSGFGGWTNLAGGRTGTTYNTIESINGSSGILGNGVNVANLGNLTPQPAPVGLIVRAYAITISTATEFAFCYENGIDGTC